MSLTVILPKNEESPALAALLRELQPYTVSLSRSHCQRLGRALYPVLDGAALVLREPYYDSGHKGLMFTPSGMTTLII